MSKPIERTLWIAKNKLDGSIAITTLCLLKSQVSFRFCHNRHEMYNNWAEAQADGWAAVEVKLTEIVE